MRGKQFLLLAMTVALAGCGSNQDIREFSLRALTLPNGKEIKIEGLRTPTDMARGAMFRESIPVGRGLLYEYAKSGRYSMWMYQTKMPLDTIWMNQRRVVVEVVEKMPPCPSASAAQCPHFGGNEDSQFILQIPGGEAARNAVKLGTIIEF